MSISKLLIEDFYPQTFFFKYAFLEDLNKVDNPHESYTFLTNTFPEIVERNPSMKMIYK